MIIQTFKQWAKTSVWRGFLLALTPAQATFYLHVIYLFPILIFCSFNLPSYNANELFWAKVFLKLGIIILQYKEPYLSTCRIVTALEPYKDLLLTKMKYSTIEVAYRIGTAVHGRVMVKVLLSNLRETFVLIILTLNLASSASDP